MDTNPQEFTQALKACKTKKTWEDFFNKFKMAIEGSRDSKALWDIFKRLRHDQLAQSYDSSIWQALLKGALASWDLELGRVIFEHCKNIYTPTFILTGAQVLLEIGRPTEAKEQAQRLLRLSNTTALERLQAEILICNCFAEEGKNSRCLTLLADIEPRVLALAIAKSEKVSYLVKLARIYYFIGEYYKAASLFEQASPIYIELSDWENAARVLYNAAASFDNAGSGNRETAYQFIKKTREIAEKANLQGPLAYCNSFDALYFYHKGDFPRALTFFKKALLSLPFGEQSMRRLHILSMISFCYLALGQLTPAKKYAQMTFTLAESDDSTRLKKRYDDLRAEILWEEGKVEKSMEVLESSIQQISHLEINTLEEFLTLNRLNLQGAWLGRISQVIQPPIKENLRENHYALLGWLHPNAWDQLIHGNYQEAEKIFTDIYDKSSVFNDQFHKGIGLHGKIICELARGSKIESLKGIRDEFKEITSELGKMPLSIKEDIFTCVEAYQSGAFEEVKKILNHSLKKPYVPFVDKLLMQTWLATASGKSPRISELWGEQLVANFTRIYFAPFIDYRSDTKIINISGFYEVDLSKHEALFDLLGYLIQKPNYHAQMEELQTNVWMQSLRSQGWQQKIRNAIQRLRNLCPFTMAPIIIHAQEVRLFSQAIQMRSPHPARAQGNDDILKLLSSNPLSSAEIAEKLGISLASAKRLLKKLKDEGINIDVIKSGRKVLYYLHKE